MTEPTTAPTLNHRGTIAGWCMFDWANSAFTTIIVTFVYSTYFAGAFAEDGDTGLALWSRGIAISSLLIALLSPIVGAIADRGGTRRRYMMIATLVCVAGTSVLTFITPDMPNAVFLALTVFVVANVAFEMSLVFYNAFLPSIVSPDRIGRVSGYGWGLGYAGGLACLVLALFGFVGLAEGGGSGFFGITAEGRLDVRLTNLLVAGWFLVFSIPTFLALRERPVPGARVELRQSFRDLAETFRKIRQYRQVVRFLIARLIYNDGLVTIIAFAGIYAQEGFGFSNRDIIVLGIVLNVAAGLGAWGFGFLDDRLGGKTTIQISLVALGIATIVGVAGTTPAWLWAAGFIIGIFMGPNQSASRSLMARFVPAQHHAEFFGFFAFSGKATAFLGPLLLGVLAEAFGQRVGLTVVLVFFIVGGLVLAGVDEREGIAAAG